MAKQDSSTFFDVLIDRLIDDVRREFEASHEPVDPSEPSDDIFDRPLPPPPVAYDDLVSKMIGFRARMARAQESNDHASDSSYGRLAIASSHGASPRFKETDVQNILSTSTPQEAKPQFQSIRAEIAFTLVCKTGAKFLKADQVGSGLTRDSLKRERRRVLLTLHPDRHPEGDRARAHQNFLDAAEAFSILAEEIAASPKAA